MQRILIPTDFSGNAMHAARYAVRLFGTGAAYTLVHAYMDLVVGDAIQPTIIPGLAQASEDGLRDFTERFIQATGAEHVRQELLYGTVLRAVIDVGHTDYIVIGSHGTGGSRLFGSNATEVAKGSTRPVFIIPEGAALRMPKRMLLAMDDSEVSAHDLAALRRLALEQNAEVAVVHVLDRIPAGNVPASRAIVETALKGIPHTFKDGLSDDPAEGIIRAADKYQAELICVLHRHTGLLQAIFHTSTAKRLVSESDLPVLVLQHSA